MKRVGFWPLVSLFMGVCCVCSWFLLLLHTERCLSGVAVRECGGVSEQESERVAPSSPPSPNSSTHVVFLMGLESTGHHVTQQVIGRMSRAMSGRRDGSMSDSLRVEQGDPVEFALMFCWAVHRFSPSAEVPWEYASWGSRGDRLREEMARHGGDTCAVFEKLLSDGRLRGGSSVLVAPVLSYPFVRTEGNWVPDINHLQRMVEHSLRGSGVTPCLRVLVLTRDWSDALRSTCARFGECASKVRVYGKYLSEMQAQLLLFDRENRGGCGEWAVLPFESLLSSPASVVSPLLRFLLPPSCLSSLSPSTLSDMRVRVRTLISAQARSAHHAEMAHSRVDNDTRWSAPLSPVTPLFNPHLSKRKWFVFHDPHHQLLDK